MVFTQTKLKAEGETVAYCKNSRKMHMIKGVRYRLLGECTKDVVRRLLPYTGYRKFNILFGVYHITNRQRYCAYLLYLDDRLIPVWLRRELPAVYDAAD